MTGRRALAGAARPLLRTVARRVQGRWPPYSRLYFVAQPGEWVFAYEAAKLSDLARSFGVRVGSSGWASHVDAQSVFHLSQFVLLRHPWRPTRSRLAVAYYHGRPGTPGYPEFDECFDVLRKHSAEIARVQVTHSDLHGIALETGIDPAKVSRIPIAVDPARFPLATAESRRSVREELGLPESAFVLGSFQKDGVGWQEGNEPKLIKGPDVLVDVTARLRERIPELVVLLVGPARGYVRRGLEQAGVAYRLVYPSDQERVPRFYHALDAYLIASRQEGGPKALLESMSSGVPVVTTRVGQAMDLVRHGENAFMVEVEDAEGLVHWLEHVHDLGGDETLRAAGRATAESNSYAAQAPLWREFLRGFVEFRP